MGPRPQEPARFRALLVALPPEIEVRHLPNLAWSMAELQHRHRALGHRLSTATVEAVAAAREIEAGIAVSTYDVGPGLVVAANPDGLALHAL